MIVSTRRRKVHRLFRFTRKNAFRFDIALFSLYNILRRSDRSPYNQEEIMKKRSIGAVILLSIITCGIYALYWLVVTTDEIEDALGSKSDGSCKNGGVALLLTFLTCDIYTFYWYYKEAQRIEILNEERGLRGNTEGWLYIVLCLLGLQIVAMAILQDQLNQIADAPVIIKDAE